MRASCAPLETFFTASCSMMRLFFELQIKSQTIIVPEETTTISGTAYIPHTHTE